MVSLSYFLSSLSRGKQTWMMSFSAPRDHSFSLFFFFTPFLEKQVHTVLDVSGIQLSSKRNGEPIWGGDKGLISIPSCFGSGFMSSCRLFDVAELSLRLAEDIILLPHSLLSAHSFSLFPSALFIPTPPPIRLSSISLLTTLTFCHPAFHYIQRGGVAFISWQNAISVMAASPH